MPRSNMDIVIEQLSHIELLVEEGRYVLWDVLRDRRVDINKTAYEVCGQINGVHTLGDIARILAEGYDVSYDDIKDDVYELYLFLRKNKLILVKGSISYNFIRLYNKLVLIDA